MTKEDLEALLQVNTPKQLIYKHIKSEITLKSNQIKKLIEMQ